MTDEKFTDDEIVLGLKCLAGEDEIFCKDCAFRDMDRGFACKKNVSKASIDLINRYKAENKRLTDLINEIGEYNEAWVKDNHDLRVELKTAKAEAIREFAERLKATPYRFREERTIYFDKPPITKMVLFVDDNDIDNLVKEMTEETP